MSLVEASRVVAVMDDPANWCAWARLDNGLALQITLEEVATVASLLIVGLRYRRLNVIGQASIILGLSIPDYGIGGFA